MTQQRVARTAGRKCLAWLLVLALGLMVLTITRQQALGSLHSHADHALHTPSVLISAVSSLGNDWIYRWRQQRVFGHGQLLLGASSYENLWPSDSASIANTTRMHDADAHPHNHESLERHHHASPSYRLGPAPFCLAAQLRPATARL